MYGKGPSAAKLVRFKAVITVESVISDVHVLNMKDLLFRTTTSCVAST